MEEGESGLKGEVNVNGLEFAAGDPKPEKPANLGLLVDYKTGLGE